MTVSLDAVVVVVAAEGEEEAYEAVVSVGEVVVVVLRVRQKWCLPWPLASPAAGRAWRVPREWGARRDEPRRAGNPTKPLCRSTRESTARMQHLQRTRGPRA